MTEKVKVRVVLHVHVDGHYFSHWPESAEADLCRRLSRIVDAVTGKTDITGGGSAKQS